MSTEIENHPHAWRIWILLLAGIKNEIGVAALMGNLKAESGLYPDIVQGDIPYSDYSKTYTANVDNGTISEYDFVHNGPNDGGYGLAQWTFYTRKQGLYDMYKSGGYSSIGSVDLACAYLLYELEHSFPSVFAALKSASSIRTASDIVLHDFENPANQSESVEIFRASEGSDIYETFSEGFEPPDNPEDPDTPTTPPTSGSKRKLSKLLLWSATLD